MTTRVYRVARVLAGSTVDRIDAINAEGHALRLEVPTGEAQSATEGRVLVLQWSLHDMPVARTPDAARADQAPTTAPERAAKSESTGRGVDEDFMQLMGRGQRGAPNPPSRGPTRDIHDEFNVLLGSARTKGQE